MGPSWEDIVAWRPEALNDVAEELRVVSRVVGTEADEVAAALAGFRSTGETADVVRQRLQEHQEVLAELARDVDQACQGVTTAVDQVREVQRLVAEVLDHVATRPDVLVDASGRLATVTAGHEAYGEDLAPVRELVDRALALAEQVDQDLLAALEGRSLQVKEEPSSEPTNSLARFLQEQSQVPRPPSFREQYPDLEEDISLTPPGGFNERRVGPPPPTGLN